MIHSWKNQTKVYPGKIISDRTKAGIYTSKRTLLTLLSALDNHPLMIFPLEPPFSSGISQLAMFDYQKV
jgi:hypothetical protein